MTQEKTAETEAHPLAIVSLVVGILGLVGVLPVIGSILAVFTANKALRDIEENPAYGGDSLARAGKTLGNLGLGLIVLGLLTIILVFAFAAGPPAGALLI